MEQVAGIRELKARLSRYLREVKAGGTVVITERGEPIGRIVPYAETVDERLGRLERAGILAWSGRRLSVSEPIERRSDARDVADLLLEDRG